MNFATKAGAKVISFLYPAKHFSFFEKYFIGREIEVIKPTQQHHFNYFNYPLNFRFKRLQK